MKNKIQKIILFLFLSSPLFVFAEDMSNLKGILDWASSLLKDKVLPLLITIGVVMFIFGIIKFYLLPGNEKDKEKLKGFLVKGLIALFVMISFWGIIKIFTTTFDLEGKKPIPPRIPDVIE